MGIHKTSMSKFRTPCSNEICAFIDADQVDWQWQPCGKPWEDLAPLRSWIAGLMSEQLRQHPNQHSILMYRLPITVTTMQNVHTTAHGLILRARQVMDVAAIQNAFSADLGYMRINNCSVNSAWYQYLTSISIGTRPYD